MPPEMSWVAGGFIAIMVAGFLFSRYMRTRPTSEELEMRRRTAINAMGKLGDGEIIDIDGSAIVYSYHVAGVAYEASQDLSALQSTLPEDPMSMIGPVSVKYDPRNPANSIVIAEQWSGIRRLG